MKNIFLFFVLLLPAFSHPYSSPTAPEKMSAIRIPVEKIIAIPSIPNRPVLVTAKEEGMYLTCAPVKLTAAKYFLLTAELLRQLGSKNQLFCDNGIIYNMPLK